MQSVSKFYGALRNERGVRLGATLILLVAAAINLIFWLPDVSINLGQLSIHPSPGRSLAADVTAGTLIVMIVAVCVGGFVAYSEDIEEQPLRALQWAVYALMLSGFTAWLITLLLALGWAAILDAVGP